MTVALVEPGAVGSVIAGALVGTPDIDLTIGARASFERLVVAGIDPDIDAAPATPDAAPSGATRGCYPQ